MSKKILLIDDEEYIVKMLELKLKEDGYECLSCTTTQDGIKLAKSNTPHLIIMDIMMPNIDGLEATKILKTSPETKDIKHGLQMVAEGKIYGQIDAISSINHYIDRHQTLKNKS